MLPSKSSKSKSEVLPCVPCLTSEQWCDDKVTPVDDRQRGKEWRGYGEKSFVSGRSEA